MALCVYILLLIYIYIHTHVLAVYSSLLTDFLVWERLLLTLHTAWTARKLYEKVLLLDTHLCLHFRTQMIFLCLSSFSHSFLAQMQVLEKGTHSERPRQQCRSCECPSHSFSLSPALTNAVSKDSCWDSWGCKPLRKMAPASVSDVNLICHFLVKCSVLIWLQGSGLQTSLGPFTWTTPRMWRWQRLTVTKLWQWSSNMMTN